MTDETTLSVSPVHSPFIQRENIYMDHFLQAHHIAGPYIHLSDLARLISDPRVLAKVERNPSLRAAILSNTFLAEEISHSPALLKMLVSNPALLSAVISNPGILRVIKESPAILAEILRNPAQSIETILQNISGRNKSNQLEENMKNIANKKPAPSQVLYKSEKPNILTTKLPLETRKTTSKASLKIPINIPNVRTIEGKVQAKIPLIQKQSAGIYIDPKTLAMHPSLLVLLAATAFSASRTKITGSQEELETQTERQQLTPLQEPSPIHEVEEASEIHLMKETIA